MVYDSSGYGQARVVNTLFAHALKVRSYGFFRYFDEPGKATARSTHRWAEAPIKIARMTLTIKLDGNLSSFQLANSAPPLSVTDSAIAPSARISP